MRMASFTDCMQVLEHYGIDPAAKRAIDVGGTEQVYLKIGRTVEIARNPLLRANPHLRFLDQGFNVEALGTRADETVDFLEPASIAQLGSSFDLVFCFDTLEHVANPFRFCDHLVRVTRPGGYIYVSTLFSFVYHASPEDYFRFSPSGLRECFSSDANESRKQVSILWSDWETDGHGVAILVYKGSPNAKLDPGFPILQGTQRIGPLRMSLCRIVRRIERWLCKD
jgi:SAM-dependent methyltransferase